MSVPFPSSGVEEGGGMALDTGLLRTSFDLVLARQPNLTHVFYDDLFSRYPAARPLFGRTHSLEMQEQMLAEALVAVMDHLEDASWLQATLRQLGAKHAAYGVTEEMYGWVGESLLATLSKVAGSDWTPAHETAWKDTYGAIADMMLAGYPVPAREGETSRSPAHTPAARWPWSRWIRQRRQAVRR